MSVYTTYVFAISIVLISCNQSPQSKAQWEVDFIDNFDEFNTENWQDQRIWVNNEKQCYVPNGQYGTREISYGILKIKLIALEEELPCDNLDKFGNPHPNTNYVAARICSKNRKEFIKGRWTARIKLSTNGEAGMFPAWWILGSKNNEAPVQEKDENICWPMTGSGEIDIFEHHGDYLKDEFTSGAIISEGECDKGDWQSARRDFPATLNEFHEYSVEWENSDLIYRLDGKEIYRNEGLGDKYPEPMFAILNYARISSKIDSASSKEWVMEVDWVKHEKRLGN